MRARIFWTLWLALAVTAAWTPAAVHLSRLEALGATLGPRAEWLIPALPIALFAVMLAANWITTRRRHLWTAVALVLALPAVMHPAATLIALTIAASCTLSGTWAFRRLGLDVPVSIAALAGAGLLTQLLTLLGAAHAIAPWTVAAMLALPLLSHKTVRFVAGRLRSIEPAPGAGPAIVLAVAAGLLAMPLALAPSSAFDPVRDHLSASWNITRTGSIDPMPVEPLTYFPLGFELLSAAAETFGGQPASQLSAVIWFVVLLGAGAATARQWGAPAWAADIGAAACAAIPFLHWTGSVPKNDCLMAGYQIAALFAIGASRREQSNRWLLAAAWFAAHAFGIKHTAVFGGATLGLLWLAAAIRNGRWLRIATIAIPIVAATGFHWHARTAIEKGSPLYPESASGRTRISADHAVESGGLLRYPRVFLDMQFKGSPGAFESPTANPAGFFIAIFLPLAIFARRPERDPLRAHAWIFCAIYFVLWAGSISTLRYAIAPLVVFVFLIAERLSGWASRFLVRVAYSAAGALSIAIAMTIEIGHSEAMYWLGKVDGPGYLRLTIPMYAALEQANRRAAPGDWTLSAGNCARRYAADPARFVCVFEEDGWSPGELPAQLRERNYRFLILPTRIADSLDYPVVYRDRGFSLVARW